MTEENLWKEVPLFQEDGEVPKLNYYPAEHKCHSGTVVIFPGGAYSHRAPHEGEGYASFLNANGFDAFVVDYRISPYRYPVELLDARRAVRTVRSRAKEFGIDPEKIAVMGSSAGGNLVGILCTCGYSFPEEVKYDMPEVSFMPNAQILCYPYICMADEKLIHKGCNANLLGTEPAVPAADLSPELHVKDCPPPAFFFHTFSDGGVSVLHSFNYAKALKEKGGSVEMHIYPEGKHGLGLCEAEPRLLPYVARWGGELIRWLCHIGF